MNLKKSLFKIYSKIIENQFPSTSLGISGDEDIPGGVQFCSYGDDKKIGLNGHAYKNHEGKWFICPSNGESIQYYWQINLHELSLGRGQFFDNLSELREALHEDTKSDRFDEI